MPSLLPGVESLNKQYVTNDSTGKAGGTTSGHRGIAPGLPGTARGRAAGGCVSAWPAEGGRCVPTADTPGTTCSRCTSAKRACYPPRPQNALTAEAQRQAGTPLPGDRRDSPGSGLPHRTVLPEEVKQPACLSARLPRRLGGSGRPRSRPERPSAPSPGARRPLTPPSPARPRAHPRPRPGT